MSPRFVHFKQSHRSNTSSVKKPVVEEAQEDPQAEKGEKKEKKSEFFYGSVESNSAPWLPMIFFFD